MNTSKRRNVVMIICDTLRPDYLHAYGADFIPTPALDALAANGTTFTNAITASTVCAPARAAVLTGLHVSAHDAWTNNIPCKEGTVYLPERLNAAGYMTAAVGCYDHAPAYNPIGYQYFCPNYEGTEESPSWKALKEAHPEAGSYKDTTEDGLHFRYEEAYHYDRWNERQAERFLESWTQEGQAPDGSGREMSGSPFFLYLGFLMPHAPYLPPQEVAGSVDPEKVPEPWPLTRDDIPAVEQYRRAFLNPADLEAVKEQRRKERVAYCEMIVQVDRMVGDLIQKLKDLGIYEDTTIIFTSDHGSMENDYNISTKGPWPYSPQLFVPLIVSNHPGIPTDAHSDILCGNMDIGATVLDIAGDAKPFGVSRSLIGMQAGTIPEREVNLSEFCDSVKQLVDKQYTFSYYPFTGVCTLFDRIADPRLTKNLAQDPEYQPVVQKFLMRTIDYMVLNKGVRIEAHDLNPEVRKGIEVLDPNFLDHFDICYPLGSKEEVHRVEAAGLDPNYNEFCKEHPIKAHYGVYFMEEETQ